MAEREVIALRKALHDQYLAVEKLQTEIEEERKASASGTNEALSMILRLQEEKAIEKMEASQYRRIAEEKIRHAEETSRILREVIFQKELEINAFRYQVQAYNQKLLNIFAKDPWLTTNSLFLDKASFDCTVRRNISLPTVRLEQLCSEINGNDYAEKRCENCKEGKLQGLSRKSTWEHIEGNNRVKDCIKLKAFVNDDVCKLPSRIRLNCGEFSRLPAEARFTKRRDGFPMRSSSCLEMDADSYVRPVDVQDIYEGPKNNSNKVSKELILEAEDCMEMPHPMSEKATSYLLRDRDKLDKGSTYIRQGKRAFTPTKDAQLESLSETPEHKIRNATKQTDLEQIKFQMKHLEDEVRKLRQVHSERENKQLDNLIEVNTKVDMTQQHIQQQQQQQVQEILSSPLIQSNMKDKQIRKSPPQDDYLITNFIEAMLSFSI
ncbi:uncharacterized protein [Typha angustifolia]|uniref:uncharacterized protein n=1 Tax=Typha angustifolia TaxID=59011 RepID=UPI003C2EF40B